MNPCGKEWHPNIYAALVRLRKILAQPNVYRPQTLSVYECEQCEGWHVGHDYKLENRPISICVGEMK